MPVYDYRCSDCGTQYDVYHKVREEIDEIMCPSCGSHTYKKMMSVPAAIVSHVGTASQAAQDTCDMGDACCGRQGGSCSLN